MATVSAREANQPPAAPIRTLEALSRWCNRTSEVLVIGMMAVMSVVVLVQVFLRYVVQASLSWSEELARYLMVWIGLFGASLALREGRHIEVTLLLDRLPRVLRTTLTGVALLAVLGFLGLVFSQGIVLTRNIWLQRSPAMSLPMVIPYAAIPLGSVFMMVQVLLTLCRLVTEPKRPGAE